MSNRQRKLRMEQMEARQMMAGDVTASVVNGNLFLNEAAGQAGLDNSVVVREIAPGKIRVTGGLTADNTASLVNGAASQVFDVAGSLFVNFGAGNDNLEIKGINDMLRFETVHFTEVHINMAAPASKSATATLTGLQPVQPADKDNVILRGLFSSGSVWVNTGIGDDAVNVSGSEIGNTQNPASNLTINTGAGADTVDVKMGGVPGVGTIRGSLDIQTFASLSENDKDIVRIQRMNVGSDVHVRTGGGNDDIQVLESFINKNLDFDAGAGNDTAVLRKVTTIDSIMARLGEGNDKLSTDFLNTKKLTLDGGGGYDQLFKKKDQWVEQRSESGWEYVPTPSKTGTFTGLLG